jgi:hypothetical protein
MFAVDYSSFPSLQSAKTLRLRGQNSFRAAKNATTWELTNGENMLDTMYFLERNCGSG